MPAPWVVQMELKLQSCWCWAKLISKASRQTSVDISTGEDVGLVPKSVINQRLGTRTQSPPSHRNASPIGRDLVRGWEGNSGKSCGIKIMTPMFSDSNRNGGWSFGG